MLTIFTPSYNRAKTLSRLYHSLQNQTCFDFEWLVIDDGSTDGTSTLLRMWEKEDNSFPLRYQVVENGGKQRAINKALELAYGDYFFIVDSDDILTPDAVSFIISGFDSLPMDSDYIGISGLRGDFDGKPFSSNMKFGNSLYIDANNLQRKDNGLDRDMAEAFYTAKIRQYPFPVWKDEKFTPEAVVWDQMALDGYKIRWLNHVIYEGEYLEGGLTKSSWSLLKNNLMGYAMLFNSQLRYTKEFRSRVSLVLNFLSCCFLKGNVKYVKNSNARILSVLLLPVGFMLSLRRRKQFKRYA